ncbi:hypothetical protein KIPB_010872, partial [Kipferlia bialata]|eukprot:g10872.t1
MVSRKAALAKRRKAVTKPAPAPRVVAPVTSGVIKADGTPVSGDIPPQ